MLELEGADVSEQLTTTDAAGTTGAAVGPTAETPAPGSPQAAASSAPSPATSSPAPAPPAPAASLQNALTLVLPIADEAAYERLQRKLAFMQDPPESSPLAQALDRVGTVHFARFVFLSKAEFAVITEYDGDFGTYVMDFVHVIGWIFDQLLAEIAEPHPSIPIEADPDGFLKYVKEHDWSNTGPLYSAYPSRPAIDIRPAPKS
jgi:hypothetical protein